MIKKNFSLLMIISAIFVFAITSCNKDDSDSPGEAKIGPVPTKFTTKVMIEENTGAWCGWCVLGADGIKTASDAHPGKVNAVAIHGGSTEVMFIPEYNTLLSFCGATGVPHYQLNRGIGGGFPGSFQSEITAALALEAECGLAIDAKKSSGNNVSFDVHAGFKAGVTGDYRLIVYLVEDSVKNADPAYNQANYVSGNSKYATNYYFNQPNPITNFGHKHVARKLMSASLSGGDQIPNDNVTINKYYFKNYTFTIPEGSGWKSTNLRVVAGILKYSATCKNQWIMNSQSVKLGSLKNWD